MQLEGKRVWELSLEEIAYIHRYRHMNHYVHAALETYHRSVLPLDRPVTVRREVVPAYLYEVLQKLSEFSPLLGHKDPAYVRAGITFYTYNLYLALNEMPEEDVPAVAALLAACAYLSIVSEKNDNVPLWNYPVVRPKSPQVEATVARLLDAGDDTLQIIPALVGHGRTLGDDGTPLSDVYSFIPLVISCLITCMENGDDPRRIGQALVCTEKAMCAYEQHHGLVDANDPGRLKNPNDIRYRNTLYLYGGMFFERQGARERATEWYLKGIGDWSSTSWPGGYFLVKLKVVERLLLGYHLSRDNVVQGHVRILIDRILRQALQGAASYAYKIMEAFRENPENQVQNRYLMTGTNKPLLYAEEPSREVYLCALVYNKFALGTDYQDIDYSRYFEV